MQNEEEGIRQRILTTSFSSFHILHSAFVFLHSKGFPMPTDIDQAEHKRDKRLRKRLLQVLNAARVRPEVGGASGRFIYDVVDAAVPGGQRFESDAHMLGLMRDLIAAGYVEERADRNYAWQTPGV